MLIIKLNRRRIWFEVPVEVAAMFRPDVAAHIRDTEDWVVIWNSINWDRHDALMANRLHRKLITGHLPNLRGPRPGGDDDLIGSDMPSGCLHTANFAILDGDTGHTR